MPVFQATEYRRQYHAFFDPSRHDLRVGGKSDPDQSGHIWWIVHRDDDAIAYVRDPSVREYDEFAASGADYWSLTRRIAESVDSDPLADWPASLSLALILAIAEHVVGPLAALHSGHQSMLLS